MRKPFSRGTSLPVLALLSSLSLPLHAQTGEAIGVVVTTKGQVAARDANGTLRTLSRRSELFEADTILVGGNGYAQVRMVDDAQVSFKANTEFAFDTYRFDDNPATPDSAAMSMLRGGFLTISGTIGDADEDDYRVDTPYASIGIRGTMHGAVIVGELLYTGVYDGGTTIYNNEGVLDAGLGAAYDFTVTRDGEAPEGLQEAPGVLTLLNLTPGADVEDGADEEETEAAADPAAVDDGADAADDGAGAADAGPDDTDTNAPAPTPVPDFDALGTEDAAANTNNGVNNLAAVTNPADGNAAPDLVNNSNDLAVVSGTTGGDPQEEVNPLLFSRVPEELNETASRDGDTSEDNSNSGNGNTDTSDRGNSGNDSTDTSDRGNSGNDSTDTSDRGNSGNDNSNTDDRGNSGNDTSTSDRGNSGSDTDTSDRGNSNNDKTDTDTSDRGNSNNDKTDTDTSDRGNSNSDKTDNDTSDRGNSNSDTTDDGKPNDNKDDTTGNSNNDRENENDRDDTNSTTTTRALLLPDANDPVSASSLPDEGRIKLSWGLWDSLSGLTLQNSSLTAYTFVLADGEWYVLRPANMANLSGHATYHGGADFLGRDESGGALLDVEMAFDVDLGGGPGAISNGSLQVLDSSNEAWRVTFNGDLRGATATMTQINGTFGTLEPVSGSLGGVFVGTGDAPDFVSGFSLHAGESYVQGLSVLGQACTDCD